ncbi:hypothetical protein Hdeb2414_s0013g00413761 [Helianthus debilis subsp. tardiflorus]
MLKIYRSCEDRILCITFHDSHRGTLLEEDASGFLGKRLAPNEDKETNCEVDWSSFNELCSSSTNKISVGSKDWASVYLASTPQAAQLGLNFPGADEVQ